MNSTINRGPMALLACTLLIGSSGIDAQELPQAAASALLAHAATTYPGPGETLAVETDHFPSPQAARSQATRLGLPAGTNAELVRCEERHRQCSIEGGERLVRILEYSVAEPGREIHMRIVVSHEWEREDGEARRIFPTLRRIVLLNDGGWRVTEDEVMLRG